jgi:hypothetical protein
MALSRGLVLCLISCLDLFAFSSLSRCHQRPVLAVRDEYAMKTGEINSWFGYPGDQSGNGRLYGPPPFVKTSIDAYRNLTACLYPALSGDLKLPLP